MRDTGASPIPITLLTGFLGSGKTTLLRKLVARPQFAHCALIINEIGEVGVDHHLVRDLHEHPVVLSNGCLCCTVRDDLIEALRELLARRGREDMPSYPRVFIETTGLADPAPVMQSLVRDPVVMEHYRIDGVVTTVDAVFGMGQLDARREAVKQVVVADRIVLTKTDLAEPRQREALAARLRTLNPAAPVVVAVQGELDPAAIIDTGYAAPEAAPANVVGWLAAGRYRPVTGAQTLFGRRADAVHDSAVHSFVVRFAHPLDRHVVLAALNLLCAIEGERILRIKGVLDVAGEPCPLVLHAVQHIIYPPVQLGSRPEGYSGPALVFIVRDLDPAFVHHILAGALGEDAIVPAAPLPVPENLSA